MNELHRRLHLLFEMDEELECCMKSWHMSVLHIGAIQSKFEAVRLPL